MVKLLDQFKENILKTYKVDPLQLDSIIQEKLEKSALPYNKDLTDTELKAIAKTKIYKDFSKKLKKDIYFGLRTYQRNDNHVSSMERQSEISEFLNQIDQYLKNANSVLDIGGGMFLEQLQIAKYSNIKRYIWLDKDKVSYEKLKRYVSDNKLQNIELICENIGDRKFEQQDLVIMLKLIPVIARQEKELLNYLANIPAKTIIVTGSKEAMVKKKDIQKREESVIKEFIGLTDKSIVDKIEISNEFGYVIS